MNLYAPGEAQTWPWRDVEHIQDFRGVLRSIREKTRSYIVGERPWKAEFRKNVEEDYKLIHLVHVRVAPAPAVLDPQLGDCSSADQSSGQESSNERSPWLWPGIAGQFKGQWGELYIFVWNDKFFIDNGGKWMSRRVKKYPSDVKLIKCRNWRNLKEC